MLSRTLMQCTPTGKMLSFLVSTFFFFFLQMRLSCTDTNHKKLMRCFFPSCGPYRMEIGQVEKMISLSPSHRAHLLVLCLPSSHTELFFLGGTNHTDTVLLWSFGVGKRQPLSFPPLSLWLFLCRSHIVQGYDYRCEQSSAADTNNVVSFWMWSLVRIWSRVIIPCSHWKFSSRDRGLTQIM